jgi:hypothetical protein
MFSGSLIANPDELIVVVRPPPARRDAIGIPDAVPETAMV